MMNILNSILVKPILISSIFAAATYFVVDEKKGIGELNGNDLTNPAKNLPCCASTPSRFALGPVPKAKNGMVLIQGGTFSMGTDSKESYPHERPAHNVKMKAFWIDEAEVTNAQYAAFVKATGYKTVAERKPEWEELKKQLPPGTPKPPASQLVASSMVFIAPTQPVETDDITHWWHWVEGASWQHPEGPKSDIKLRMNHPVVQIAYEDAMAYCKWAGKRLPTEAEWEYAARGGLVQQTYAWGNDFMPGGKYMANTFQGRFPNNNNNKDGFLGTASIKSFPANGYGLYDMIGNVWEWTSDWFATDYYASLKGKAAVDPKGADSCKNSDNPYAIERVIKGGSFLCADNYCINYRPSARRGSSYDSGTSNLGFRCAKDAE